MNDERVRKQFDWKKYFIEYSFRGKRMSCN